MFSKFFTFDIIKVNQIKKTKNCNTGYTIDLKHDYKHSSHGTIMTENSVIYCHQLNFCNSKL